MALEDAKRLLAALKRGRVEYVLVGSRAMAVLGLIRATENMDFFVSPKKDTVRPRDRVDAAWIRKIFGLDED